MSRTEMVLFREKLDQKRKQMGRRYLLTESAKERDKIQAAIYAFAELANVVKDMINEVYNVPQK